MQIQPYKKDLCFGFTILRYLLYATPIATCVRLQGETVVPCGLDKRHAEACQLFQGLAVDSIEGVQALAVHVDDRNHLSVLEDGHHNF